MSDTGHTAIVDSDALIALFDQHDTHHLTAQKTLAHVASHHLTLIYPSITIIETVTTFQRKLNKPELAQKISQLIVDKKLYIENVDQSLLEKAHLLFNPHGSKQNTFFDAIVAATANKLKTKLIFSFDNWYTKIGFTLLSDTTPPAHNPPTPHSS